MPEYSQIKAMLAITKASLRATFRSPSAVIFSIAFPLIFILVFGFLSSGGNINVNVAMTQGSDTANPIYTAIKNIAHFYSITSLQTQERTRCKPGYPHL